MIEGPSDKTPTMSPHDCDEETPLLVDQQQPSNVDVYERFSKLQKHVCVAAVSSTGLLPLFVSGSFIPSIPQISKELNADPATISLAVSLSMFATAIGSLTCAVYAGFYGRRPVYLWSLPLLCIGSVIVTVSKAVPELLAGRFIQAFGASGGFSLGAAVIGDIYKVEERGAALGVFYGAIMLGPSIAPFCGGLAAEYGSWRYMQAALGIGGLLAFAVIALFLPETSHPGSRGIDKVVVACEGSRSKFVWVNPLASLRLLRSPNLLIASLAGSAALLTDFVLLIPLPYTIGKTYNITNQALIGACFLPSGLGNMAGGVIAGRVSDHIIVKWKKKRGNVWVPEDRLRATLFGAAVLLPMSMILFGLVTQFVEGTPGIVLNLVCLFMNGFGLSSVFTVTSAYAVDTYQSRSAETVAAINAFRACVVAVMSTGILPAEEHIGTLYTNILAAGFAWIGFGLICLIIRYGAKMRAWVDAGYPTQNNT